MRALCWLSSLLVQDLGASGAMSGGDQSASILTSRDLLVALGIPAPSDSKSGYADLARDRVGALERTHVKAMYGPGEQLTYCEHIKPYGLIGHNYLKYYSWTIDFDDRMFLFDH